MEMELAECRYWFEQTIAVEAEKAQALKAAQAAARSRK
jgi:hypothetical protein